MCSGQSHAASAGKRPIWSFLRRISLITSGETPLIQRLRFLDCRPTALGRQRPIVGNGRSSRLTSLVRRLVKHRKTQWKAMSSFALVGQSNHLKLLNTYGPLRAATSPCKTMTIGVQARAGSWFSVLPPFQHLCTSGAQNAARR